MKIVIKKYEIPNSKTVSYRIIELPPEFQNRRLERMKQKQKEKEERKMNNIIKIGNADFKIEEMNENELVGIAEIIYTKEEQIIRIAEGLSKEKRRIIIISAIIYLIRDLYGFNILDEGTINIISETINQVMEDNYL